MDYYLDLSFSYVYSDTPPVRDGGALRRLGRRKVEEARFLLVTVHLRYGAKVGLFGTSYQTWHSVPRG